MISKPTHHDSHLKSTDELENGVGTKQNTLLEACGIEFLDQIGENGHDQCIIHRVHKVCNVGNNDDALLFRR